MKKKFLTILFFLLSIAINFGQTTAVAPSGDGSEANPYQIATLGNLSWLAQNSSAWAYAVISEQTANIDAAQTQYWDDADDNSDGDKYNDPNDGTSAGNNEGFSPIGNTTTAFEGAYDGQSNTITNLTINRISTDYIGLFGKTDGNGTYTIVNVGLENANITGNDLVGSLGGLLSNGDVENCYSTNCNVTGHDEVGGLVGEYNYHKTMTNCYSTGNITGENMIGGLVGKLNNSAIITKSYSTANVTRGSEDTWEYAGGFAGASYQGTISECYSRGDVTGNYIGGFIGSSDVTTISNCYSAGSAVATDGWNRGAFCFTITDGSIEYSYTVSDVGGNDNKGFIGDDNGTPTYSNNFFDTETTGQAGATGATGKTTTEMKTQTTYTDAGWDFTNTWEIIAPSSPVANGNTLKKINADGNYPRLQNQPDAVLPVELTTFNANVNGNSVELFWSTATEVNNFGFDVERKMGKEEWKTVTFIKGAGNSNSPKNYTYSDVSVLAGKYYYRLKQKDIDGSFEYSKIIEATIGIPEEFEVSQNYPNPFNPTTTISFSLPNKSNVQVVVYNAIGEIITTLVNKNLNAGVHKINFDAGNLTSGIYFYKVTMGNNVLTHKMILLK